MKPRPNSGYIIGVFAVLKFGSSKVVLGKSAVAGEGANIKTLGRAIIGELAQVNTHFGGENKSAFAVVCKIH